MLRAQYFWGFLDLLASLCGDRNIHYSEALSLNAEPPMKMPRELADGLQWRHPCGNAQQKAYANAYSSFRMP